MKKRNILSLLFINLVIISPLFGANPAEMSQLLRMYTPEDLATAYQLQCAYDQQGAQAQKFADADARQIAKKTREYDLPIQEDLQIARDLQFAQNLQRQYDREDAQAQKFADADARQIAKKTREYDLPVQKDLQIARDLQFAQNLQRQYDREDAQALQLADADDVLDLGWVIIDSQSKTPDSTFRLPYASINSLSKTGALDPVFYPRRRESVSWPQFRDRGIRENPLDQNSRVIEHRREQVGSIAFTRNYLDRTIIPTISFSQLGNTCGICSLYNALCFATNDNGFTNLSKFKQFCTQVENYLNQNEEQANKIKSKSGFVDIEDLNNFILACPSCKPLLTETSPYSLKKDISIIGELAQIESLFQWPEEKQGMLQERNFSHVIDNIQRFRAGEANRQEIMVNTGSHWLTMVIEHDPAVQDDLIFYTDSLGVDRRCYSDVIDRVYRLYRTDKIPVYSN